MCCSWILLKGSRERCAHRRTERGDTSPGHQWGLALSLRYLHLLCFRARSIKYETLRQKEAEWKGRERGPQRAPLNAFEGPLRWGVSWGLNIQTHTGTHNPPAPTNEWVVEQISTFASSVFVLFFDHSSGYTTKGTLWVKLDLKASVSRC